MNWPVQLTLVPSGAPYLRNADILLVADCVPFACADFHQRFLRGMPVIIGCPKLDQVEFYVKKLAEIVRAAQPRSLRSLPSFTWKFPAALASPASPSMRSARLKATRRSRTSPSGPAARSSPLPRPLP